LSSCLVRPRPAHGDRAAIPLGGAIIIHVKA
jgi:hypothetical protein